MRIQAEEIKFSYGEKNILNSISADIQDKSFVGIIGPNGSGKSTFLKCIYRILTPSSGKIEFDNVNLKDISIRESAKMMSVVAQHNDTQFDLTVLEMALMGRTPYKKFMERDNLEDYQMVESALEKVGMLDYKHRTYNSLSGGEKQRIILARALVQDTPCLILDEPTNHLDIHYQLQFMNIAKNLGVTVISAIHDLNIAARYCDKIYALKDGEMIVYGAPKDVLTSDVIRKLYNVEAKIVEIDGFLQVIYKDITL